MPRKRQLGNVVSAGGIGISGSYAQRFFLLLVRLAALINNFSMFNDNTNMHVCRYFWTCTVCEGRHEEGRGYLTPKSKHALEVD